MILMSDFRPGNTKHEEGHSTEPAAKVEQPPKHIFLPLSGKDAITNLHVEGIIEYLQGNI